MSYKTEKYAIATPAFYGNADRTGFEIKEYFDHPETAKGVALSRGLVDFKIMKISSIRFDYCEDVYDHGNVHPAEWVDLDQIQQNREANRIHWEKVKSLTQENYWDSQD
jgi:hypothetical protein